MNHHPQTPATKANPRHATRLLARILGGALLTLLTAGATQATAATECPNQAFRTGPSANLPDCRAYELVSPSNTDGRRLEFDLRGLGNNVFPTGLASQSGGSFLFETAGTPLSEPTGSSGTADVYEAVRAADGWRVPRRLSPSGPQLGAANPVPGGVSADHGYALVGIGGSGISLPEQAGSLAEVGVFSSYLVRPEGFFELVGVGSLGQERQAEARWISPQGDHLIFTTGGGQNSGAEAKRLEPSAPPTGTPAIYDRSALGGPTHVVSLLPGDITPEAGQSGAARYQGVSEDGSVVAFKIGNGGALYARIDNSSTVRVPDAALAETLSCAAGPGSATLSFEWLRNGAPIAGQTSSTYTTGVADQGAAVQCRVTASTGEGASRATSVAKTVEPAGQVAPPVLSSLIGTFGALTVGQTLTCNANEWSGNPTFAYQWLRNGLPIVGQTVSTYTLVPADNETAVQCEVTATNAGGATVADSSLKLIRSEPPVNTGTSANAPTIIGTATVGEALTCANGTWTGGSSFSDRWFRNGAEIAGATSASYTLVADDEGKAIQCQVTATNAGGSGVAISADDVISPDPSPLPPTRPSTAISVTGTRNIGQVLTCAHGTWGNSPTEFVYQWLRNGVAIGGANSGATPASQASYAYTTVSADLDKLIQCRITATNAGGASNVASPATQVNVVVAAPPAATASIGDGSQTFAGLTANGDRLFFVEGGDVYDFDTTTATTQRITNVGNAELANISPDGSHVYFISESQIGGKGTAGKPNFYVWDRADGETTFIATVEPSDLDGIPALNNWATSVVNGEVGPSNAGPGYSSSRTTPDGSVIAFESAAELTSYKNAGNKEIYRYDTHDHSLLCVSCNPSGEPATSSARFEFAGESQPLSTQAIVHNLSDDSDRVFFETEESLVSRDVDNNNDIYEWSGGAEPTISLISSGQTPLYSIEGSGRLLANLIGAVTPSGSDVFFLSVDALTSTAGTGGVPAIYDAHIGGGFAESSGVSCVGEACRPALASPRLTQTATAVFAGAGNLDLVSPLPKPVVKAKTKPLTRAQQFARAMKQCRKSKNSKGRRTACEKNARKRYGRGK